LRREHAVFHRSSFLSGREQRGSGLPDVWWFRPDGRRMNQRDWQREDARTLGVFLNGSEIPTRTPHGEEVVDDSFLLLFNAHHEPVTFQLPARRFGARWTVELSTHSEPAEGASLAARTDVEIADRAMVLLRRA
jgi:glycogen operon protein